LTNSKDGYKSILLAVDSFSKWTEAFTLKSQEATEVAQVLYDQVFTRYGAPRIPLSDRGQNFMSKLINALCKLFLITHHYTSSYHPQTNAACERVNSTLAQSLRTYCDKDQQNWPSLIPGIMMAFRMSPSTQSTGYPPFHMLYGKEMHMPFDVALMPNDSMNQNAKQYMEDLITRLQVAKDIAKENVQ